MARNENQETVEEKDLKKAGDKYKKREGGSKGKVEKEEKRQK